MKKLFFIILVLLSAVVVAQTSKKVTMAYSAIIPGVTHSHYTQPISWAAPYSMQWKVTPTAFNRSDSTQIIFEGSIDNTTWYKTTLPGTPVISAGTNTTAEYHSSTGTFSVKATSTASLYVGASLFYTPTWYLTPPYFRATVTHYETDTVYITGLLYVKP